MLGKIKPDSQQKLFQTRLIDLINLEHPLVKLAQELDWLKMEAEFQHLYAEQAFYSDSENCRIVTIERDV